MSQELQICGAFRFQNEDFEVYLESETNLVWILKPNDFYFGAKNFNKLQANDPLEALKLASETILSFDQALHQNRDFKRNKRQKKRLLSEV